MRMVQIGIIVGFILLILPETAAIIVFYGRIWKKTHDTGRDEIFENRR